MKLSEQINGMNSVTEARAASKIHMSMHPIDYDLVRSLGFDVDENYRFDPMVIKNPKVGAFICKMIAAGYDTIHVQGTGSEPRLHFKK